MWTTDLDSAYRIFSVLNDRGLDLSHTDILKAETVGKLSESDQSKYAQKWENMEDHLSRESFEDLFSHIRMIYAKSKLRGTVLAEFRQYVKPTEKPKEFIDGVLDPLAQAYHSIANACYRSDANAEEINRLFNWLSRIDNSDWMPPAILYLSKNDADPDSLLRFFTDLERLAAGIMVQRQYVGHRIQRYGKLLSAIESGDDLFAQSSPLQLSDDEKSDIVARLDGDIYLMSKVVKYVLLRLDAGLSGAGAKYDHRVVSVEHVLPQSPRSGGKWLQWFPNEEERLRTVHRLGNLLLLSKRKNSQAQNYEFDKKKQKYFSTKTGISPFALTTQVLKEDEWTPDVVKRRQQKLLRVLKDLWRLRA